MEAGKISFGLINQNIKKGNKIMNIYKNYI